VAAEDATASWRHFLPTILETWSLAEPNPKLVRLPSKTDTERQTGEGSAPTKGFCFGGSSVDRCRLFDSSHRHKRLESGKRNSGWVGYVRWGNALGCTSVAQLWHGMQTSRYHNCFTPKKLQNSSKSTAFEPSSSIWPKHAFTTFGSTSSPMHASTQARVVLRDESQQ
jgi:hypothetical protein